MSDKKILTVFGATGNQGGSIISTLLDHPELQSKYSIRAVTRDTSKPSAQELKSKVAEVVAADLNDPESLKHAVQGSYGVFAVTNYWEIFSKDKELQQGKAIADAAIAAGVKHLVWSSLPHTTKLTNGKLSQIDHFDGKAEVEEYIEANKGKSGLIATHYMPGLFMQMFKDFINPGQDGHPTIALPIPSNALFNLIDIRSDTGKWVLGIFEAGASVDGKQVQAVGDWVTGDELATSYTKYSGANVEVKYATAPRDVWKSFLIPKMGDYIAEEMAQNMDLIAEYSYYGKGAEKNQAEHDKVLLKGAKKTTLREFIEANKPWSFSK
jgi:uncharacterized protein YbjT (DUF2867 family)